MKLKEDERYILSRNKIFVENGKYLHGSWVSWRESFFNIDKGKILIVKQDKMNLKFVVVISLDSWGGPSSSGGYVRLLFSSHTFFDDWNWIYSC